MQKVSMHKTLDRLLHWSAGLMAALALFTIMWLTLIDVTGRKFLDHSLPGALEITEILMVIVIFAALPLVSWRSEHVVFDSFDHLIPSWLKDVQSRLVELLSALTFAGLAWLMSQRAERFAEYGDTTVYLQFSIAPVAWLMAALLLVTALVHLLFVFRPIPQDPVKGFAS
jgi:TRAP-type C4-dicarboxylate transport system permease small subunit